MARRKSPRRTPKSKWARKTNRKPKRKPRFKLNKKQQAIFNHLMSGGTLDGEDE